MVLTQIPGIAQNAAGKNNMFHRKELHRLSWNRRIGIPHN